MTGDSVRAVRTQLAVLGSTGKEPIMKAQQTSPRRSVAVNRPLRALRLCELSGVIGGLNPQPEPPGLNPQPEPPG